MLAVGRGRPTPIWLALLLIAILFSSAMVAPNAVFAVKAQPAPNPIFKGLLPVLRRSNVPLILPRWLPPLSPMYASLGMLKRGHYSVDLGYVPDCGGATACRIGSVEGERITRATAPLLGRAVLLARYITGHFVKYACRASCRDSTMAWNERGYRYTFGIKAGSLGQLRRIANSAITDSP
jgi:hypothetical protein